MAKLLIVEDEEAVREMLAVWCVEASYEVTTACDGQRALALFFQRCPDLVITDIHMPVMDGIELIGRLREVSRVPIIVLSALGREEDKVLGLRRGADDYVVKPVGMAELLARVEACLRRNAGPEAPPPVYSDEALTVHMEREETYVRNRKVGLTPKEFRLLVYLIQQAGRVVSVPELLRGVWGSPEYSEETVKSHIATLRRKLEEDPHQPQLIATVWGSGYRYDRPHTPAPHGGHG